MNPPKKFEPINNKGLKTYSISDRISKVSSEDICKPWKKGESFSAFLDTLPRILAGNQIREIITTISEAYKTGKTVIVGMGAHVIKVGLSPVIIDLMRRGVITAVALNGAGIIHDFELAMAGCTSEDVAASLGTGQFGMAGETGEFLSGAIRKASDDATGMGRAVGRMIIENEFNFADKSILAAGYELNIPVTVHVAFGTDIIHLHPAFDAAKAGETTHRDFRILSSVISTLEDGVYLNIGSAVIMPEIFLKALTLVRNLGHHVQKFTTVNMDFITHYRPMANVVHRPTAGGGKGFNLVGHHELMLPLIAAGVIESIDDKNN